MMPTPWDDRPVLPADGCAADATKRINCNSRPRRAVLVAAVWCLGIGGLVAAAAAAYARIAAWAGPQLRQNLAYRAERFRKVGNFVRPLPLTPGASVAQSFVAHDADLAGLRLMCVVWHMRLAACAYPWTLETMSADGLSRELVRTGTIDAMQARDWQFVLVPFAPLPDSAGRGYVFTLSGPTKPQRSPLGVPIFRATGSPTGQEVLTTTEAGAAPSTPEGCCLHMYLMYPQEARW